MDVDYEAEVPYAFVNSNDVLERAYQMATMEWTPINDVPTQNNGFFTAGEPVRGVPYSSVKEINTYLFQDVSYYTFITAVHDPFSVLYTDNISQSPYHGVNCATYYGSVCSSSVMWALGINVPYYANQIKDLSCMERVQSQFVDSLKVCDILWRNGHVQMVYCLEYDAGNVSRVTMFESSGRVAHLKSYSREQFIKLMKEGEYVSYRYKYLVYSASTFTPNPFPEIVYNNDLCPSKGDMAMYRKDDEIKIDIFSTMYDSISLEKDGAELRRDDIVKKYHIYKGLSPGIYSVRLNKGAISSEAISFEVAESRVEYTHNRGNKTLTVHFESSAIPEYLILCTNTGNSLYYPLSDTNRKNGYVVVPQMEIPEYYCKIVFRGTYGSIANAPIRVK